MTTFKPFETIMNLLKARIFALVDITVTSVLICLEPFGLGSAIGQLTSVTKQILGTIMDLFTRVAVMLDDLYARVAGVAPCRRSQ